MAVSREEAERFAKRAGLTPEQIEARIGPRCAKPYVEKGHGRASGYSAKRTRSELINRNFASDFERRIAERLWRRQVAGEISELAFQRRVKLLGCIVMIPDFRYKEDGVLIHHEAKGFANDRWRMQRKVWSQVGPTEYRVTHQKGPDEIIRPRPSDELIEYMRPFVEAYAVKIEGDSDD